MDLVRGMQSSNNDNNDNDKIESIMDVLKQIEPPPQLDDTVYLDESDELCQYNDLIENFIENALFYPQWEKEHTVIYQAEEQYEEQAEEQYEEQAEEQQEEQEEEQEQETPCTLDIINTGFIDQVFSFGLSFDNIPFTQVKDDDTLIKTIYDFQQRVFSDIYYMIQDFYNVEDLETLTISDFTGSEFIQQFNTIINQQAAQFASYFTMNNNTEKEGFKNIERFVSLTVALTIVKLILPELKQAVNNKKFTGQLFTFKHQDNQVIFTLEFFKLACTFSFNIKSKQLVSFELYEEHGEVVYIDVPDDACRLLIPLPSKISEFNIKTKEGDTIVKNKEHLVEVTRQFIEKLFVNINSKPVILSKVYNQKTKKLRNQYNLLVQLVSAALGCSTRASLTIMELKSFVSSIDETKIKGYEAALKRTNELCNTEDAKLGGRDQNIKTISPDQLLSRIFMDESFEKDICKHFASTYVQVHKDLLIQEYKCKRNIKTWDETYAEYVEIAKKRITKAETARYKKAWAENIKKIDDDAQDEITKKRKDKNYKKQVSTCIKQVYKCVQQHCITNQLHLESPAKISEKLDENGISVKMIIDKYFSVLSQLHFGKDINQVCANNFKEIDNINLIDTNLHDLILQLASKQLKQLRPSSSKTGEYNFKITAITDKKKQEAKLSLTYDKNSVALQRSQNAAKCIALGQLEESDKSQFQNQIQKQIIMSIELKQSFEEYLTFWAGVNNKDRTSVDVKSPLEIETDERFKLEGFDIEQLRSSQLARIYYQYLTEMYNILKTRKTNVSIAPDYMNLEPISSSSYIARYVKLSREQRNCLMTFRNTEQTMTVTSKNSFDRLLILSNSLLYKTNMFIDKTIILIVRDYIKQVYKGVTNEIFEDILNDIDNIKSI